MNSEEVIQNLPGPLAAWYEFKPGADALFVSGGEEACEVIFETLEDAGMKASKIAMADLAQEEGKFDYIVGAGILERAHKPQEMLEALRNLLKPSGILLIGAENRFALRSFCGDKDRFSGHVLDGIDSYSKVYGKTKEQMEGRAYSKAELTRMLVDAGIGQIKFYSVLPCLTRPQILISEEYLPNESLDLRVFPQYRSPETVFLEEEKLYAPFMENNMFHQTANAFLIECSVEGELSDADQVTVQGDRSRGEAMATVIRRGKSVSKRALYPEGRHKPTILKENEEDLKRHHIPVAEAELRDGAYVMPYIEGQIATDYFRELLRRDKDLFLRELESFRRLIESSSDHVPYEEVNWSHFDPRWEKRKKDDPDIDKWEKLAFGSEEERQSIGVILKRCYMDMVSINCFHTKEGFIFFDQEFYINCFPANAVFVRTINFIYKDSPDLEQIFPRDELLKHFNLYEHFETWCAGGNVFLAKLRNEKALAGYHRLHRRDWRIVKSNRYRMDYTQEDYDRLFANIFKGADNKKLYLFGAGMFAELFLDQFGEYYDIAGIFDNNESKWGSSLRGIKILSPAQLKETEEPFKVFICMKFFEEVLGQLKEMGVKDISIYDPRLDYEKPLRNRSGAESTAPKRYHVGYVAGAFDLFHIGHLNLLRRAKEQCDYLIAGVISDERIIAMKKTKPYISFQERLEIVQACRYVDEAVKIPDDRPNTEDAFYMYHFDVQFSGSDYEKDPDWLARKIFLQQHGADMVFFPYTESTSSTKLKEQIRGQESSFGQEAQ